MIAGVVYIDVVPIYKWQWMAVGNFVDLLFTDLIPAARCPVLDSFIYNNGFIIG